MPSKSMSFRTRCSNQRRLSPIGPKPVVPKRLGARRMSVNSTCFNDARNAEASHVVVSTAMPVVKTGVPDTPLVAPKHATKRKVDFVPLEDEVRLYLPTNEAAYHLGRKPQTLRVWSCNGTGMLQPIGRGGRLLWPVAGIKALLLKDADKAKNKAADKDTAHMKDAKRDA